MNEYWYTGTIRLNFGRTLSNGFTRIVHGGRGDYVEIHPDQILRGVLYIPDDQQWRVHHPRAYYIEYRTEGTDNVKVYLQKREVTYADYKIGMYYVSPVHLSDFEVRGKR